MKYSGTVFNAHHFKQFSEVRFQFGDQMVFVVSPFYSSVWTTDCFCCVCWETHLLEIIDHNWNSSRPTVDGRPGVKFVAELMPHLSSFSMCVCVRMNDIGCYWLAIKKVGIKFKCSISWFFHVDAANALNLNLLIFCYMFNEFRRNVVRDMRENRLKS